MVMAEVPKSKHKAVTNPDQQSELIIRRASKKAGLLSAGLSIPVGPLGLLTIIPELVGVWKLQKQMVADIAAVYGNKEEVGREQMLYCLFRYSAAHVVADVTSKSAERLLLNRMSQASFDHAVGKVSLHIGNSLTLRMSRIVLPLVGAIFLGLYSHNDTMKVGKTAKFLFKQTPEQPNQNVITFSPASIGHGSNEMVV